MSSRSSGQGSSRKRGQGRGRGRGPGRGQQSTRGSSARPSQAGDQTEEKIRTLENKIVSSGLEAAVKSLSIRPDQSLPSRPGHGTVGEGILLQANYFELNVKKPIPLHRYAISINIGEGERAPIGRKLARIVQLLLEQMPAVEFLVTDFSANIITGTKLADNSKEYMIQYSYDDHDTNVNLPTYRMTVQYVTSFEVQQLLDYLATFPRDSPEPGYKQNIIQALNMIIGHELKSSQLILSQKNKYFLFDGSQVEKSGLGQAVEAIRGYFLSVRPATGRILLNAQLKHLAVYEHSRLDKVLLDLNYRQNTDAKTMREISRVLRGLPVKVSYFNQSRKKRICGLATMNDGKELAHPPRVKRDNAHAEDVEFWVDGRGYITVATHFQEKHQTKSKFPVVNLGTQKNPSYFLAEVCTVPKGEPYRPQLSPTQTRQMLEFAVRRPDSNATSLTTTGISIIQNVSQMKLAASGVYLDANLVTVDGRILPVPDLQYTKKRSAAAAAEKEEKAKDETGKQTANLTPVNGEWNTTNMLYSRPVESFDWHVLWITLTYQSGKRFDNITDVREATGRMQECLLLTGIEAKAASRGFSMQIRNEFQCKGDIDAKFKEISQPGPKPKLLLVILPKNSKPIYNAVKQAGDITWGIHTVCVTTPKFKGANTSYLINVAMKFNLKLGGTNQQLVDNHSDFLKQGKTMVVGLDVTHPAPGEDKAPSISAIVASIDTSFGQWPAEIRVQRERKQEMVDDLKEMMIGRLKLWSQHNGGNYPEEILVYRDGVSEGQYNIVRDQELPRIRKACAEVYSAKQTNENHPRISIIVVGKRHHTRFYPTDKKHSDFRTGNIKNGTVVDRGITEAIVWDFYLTAHRAIKGTAKPAHYVVIHDEIFRFRATREPIDDGGKAGERAADMLEKLTHNLCYLYGRATKAVSVCPPAYYADIACERARVYLSRLYNEYGVVGGNATAARADEVRIHEHLKDTMFYI